MNEEWRPIAGFPGCFISDLGRLKRSSRKTISLGSIFTTADGIVYRTVGLRRGGRKFTKYMHRLVLEAFIGPCPLRHEGCHFDRNGLNNKLGNLRWGTPMDNAADKKRHGTILRGERHPSAKLTEQAVLQMIVERQEGHTFRQIGLRHGVSQYHARNVTVGHRWKHLREAQNAKGTVSSI